MNENASTTLQYRIAYIVSFISESIIWPNICLSEGDQYAENLYTNIRAFNNAFAFALSKANVNKNLASRRNGFFTFRVNGIIYHNVGSLRSQDPTTAEFSQIYFCNINKQLARRSTLFSGFDPSTIKTIQNAINLCNAFVHTLKSVAEQFCDQPIGTLHVIFREAREIGRHYNIQSSPEVAAMIIKESVDRVALLHNIIINNCITGYCSISLMNTTYITFHYVSMLSFGDNEWNMDLKCLSPNL
ncbi:hypothetical protein F4703DRAFT_1794832 [Phycomyces blakesleeanus]